MDAPDMTIEAQRRFGRRAAWAFATPGATFVGIFVINALSIGIRGHGL